MKNTLITFLYIFQYLFLIVLFSFFLAEEIIYAYYLLFLSLISDYMKLQEFNWVFNFFYSMFGSLSGLPCYSKKCQNVSIYNTFILLLCVKLDATSYIHFQNPYIKTPA